MNHVTHPLSSVDMSIFSPKISKLCSIKKYRYRLHFDTILHFDIISNSFNFFWVFTDHVLINMVTILMVSAKFPTLDPLKIKLFSNKGNDVIISVNDVTNKSLSRDSNFWRIWYLTHGLEIFHQCAKRFKMKVRKFWGKISTFAEVTGKKLVGERGGPNPE